MASSSLERRGLGGQERDAFHAVVMAIEYAADGAVGSGDRPQHAPLLRERGAAPLTSGGSGTGIASAPVDASLTKGSSGNEGCASLADAPAEILARMAWRVSAGRLCSSLPTLDTLIATIL